MERPAQRSLLDRLGVSKQEVLGLFQGQALGIRGTTKPEIENIIASGKITPKPGRKDIHFATTDMNHNNVQEIREALDSQNAEVLAQLLYTTVEKALSIGGFGSSDPSYVLAFHYPKDAAKLNAQIEDRLPYVYLESIEIPAQEVTGTYGLSDDIEANPALYEGKTGQEKRDLFFERATRAIIKRQENIN